MLADPLLLANKNGISLSHLLLYLNMGGDSYIDNKYMTAPLPHTVLSFVRLFSGSNAEQDIGFPEYDLVLDRTSLADTKPKIGNSSLSNG